MTDAPKLLPKCDPISVVLEMMRKRGFTRRDMLPVFGHRSHASEVLTRRRKLSLSMIRALVFDFGMPAECLIQDYDLVHGGSEND